MAYSPDAIDSPRVDSDGEPEAVKDCSTQGSSKSLRSAIGSFRRRSSREPSQVAGAVEEGSKSEDASGVPGDALNQPIATD